MISVLAFVLGLFLLFRGVFRFAGRQFTKTQGRQIGALLMLPTLIDFCAGIVIGVTAVQENADGELVLNQTLALERITSWTGISLLVLIGVLALIAFIIYRTPVTPSDAVYAPETGGRSAAYNPFSRTVAATPSPKPATVLTVAETAAYLHVSEAEVMALIDGGKLPAARIGDTYRIARVAIDDYLQARG